MAHPGPSPALQDSRTPLPSPPAQPQLDPQSADMPLTSAHLRTTSAPHSTSHSGHVASGRLDTIYRPHVAPYEPQQPQQQPQQPQHRSHSQTHSHSHSSHSSHTSHAGPAGPAGHSHAPLHHSKHQLPLHLSGTVGVTTTTESAGTTASMSTLSGPSYDMWSSSPAGAAPTPVARSSSAPGGAASGHYLLPHGMSASAAPATATIHRTVDSYVHGSSPGEYAPRVMPAHALPSVPDGLATPLAAAVTGGRPPHMVGAPSVAEPLTPWHLRMEAKVDRLTSEIVQLRRMLLSSTLMMQGAKPMGLNDGHMSHHMRGGLVHHAIVGAPAVHAHSTSSSGHSTSDKIDARRRRYPGFRGVPICACCNKSFCLIFNSPGGKCKRGDQCEHAHHYMPPNAPTGSIVRPLPVPASFK